MLTKDKFLPTKKSKIRCFILIILVYGLYFFENSPWLGYINNSVFNYYIKPLAWLVIAFVVWNLPSIRPKGRLKFRKLINLWAFNFAIIFIIVSVIAGVFVDGLGKSPYDHSFTGIITNLFLIVSMLIGREWLRSYLTNSLTDKENYLVFILIALCMTVIGIPFRKFIEPKEMIDIVKFISQYFIPEFCQNLFATYLVYWGGSVSSIIYMGIIQAFYWFSPILPDLQWITIALIGVLCPIFFMMSLRNIYLEAYKAIKIKDKERESSFSWIITSIVSIAIIWFSVGVFPVYPSVVVTGSMEPMIMPGDLVLINKTKENTIQIGAIIQFKKEGVLISHRIIEIKEIENKKHYRTKGDNNSAPDVEWVKPEEVKGTVVCVIPKIGWPTMLLKSRNIDSIDSLPFTNSHEQESYYP